MRVLAWVVVVGLCAEFTRAADPPTLEQLIANLGHPQFRIRDAASRELWQRGLAAKPLLEQALASDDPEVVRRANDVLDKFRWQILPTTPEPIAKAIRDYRSTDYNRQVTAIDELLKQGDAGLNALFACLSHDFGPDRQPVLDEYALTQARKRVPTLLFENKPALAERTLELSLLSKNPEAWLDYANYHTQLGRGTEALFKLDQLDKQEPTRRDRTTLVRIMVQHLHGDSATAVRAAQQQITGPEGRELLNSLLADAGRWNDLIDSEGTDAAPRSFGLDVFHLQKAGQTERANALVKSALDGGNVGTASSVGLSLLLNARPLEGIAFLRAKRSQPQLVADLLAARFQFDAAFTSLKDGPAADDEFIDDRFTIYVAIRQAKLKAQLGYREEAIKEFRRIPDQIRNTNAYPMRELLRAEMRVGYIDLALAHAAQFLAEFERNSRAFYLTPDLFETLFDEDSEPAKGWWAAIRTAELTKRETPQQQMRRVYELVTGRASADRIAEAREVMMARLERFKTSGTKSTVTRIHALRALAQLARHTEDEVAYERHLRTAIELAGAEVTNDTDGNPSGPREWVYGVDEGVKLWLELGEWFTDQKQYGDAQQVYDLAWKKYPDNPIPLYYSGRVLQLMGQKAEGQRRIDLAHVVAMGNAQMRGRFLDEMCNHGQLADAKKARDMALRSVWYWDRMRGNVWNQIARASALVKDYATAAAATERNLHFLLKTPNIVFVEGTGYLQVPLSVRINRVRAALADGKPSKAKLAELAKEALAILELMPAQVEFVTHIVPEFERLDAKAEADAIFRQTWDRFAKLRADYPQSAWACVLTGQLAAGCRRELATGLEVAKRAVELEPEWRVAKEVLAEVQFRRNDRAAAMELMKELSRHDWRNSFYKRQLARFERGDTNSPLPVGPDDD